MIAPPAAWKMAADAPPPTAAAARAACRIAPRLRLRRFLISCLRPLGGSQQAVHPADRVSLGDSWRAAVLDALQDEDLMRQQAFAAVTLRDGLVQLQKFESDRLPGSEVSSFAVDSR